MASYRGIVSEVLRVLNRMSTFSVYTPGPVMKFGTAAQAELLAKILVPSASVVSTAYAASSGAYSPSRVGKPKSVETKFGARA